jgi:hypothetical protein
MSDNSIMYAVLIGLAIVILVLLMSDGMGSATVEHFNMVNACEEMFHNPDHLIKCKTLRNGQLEYGTGIEYTYPKYLKNKEEHIDLAEDLYWAHVENLNELGRLGKCHTVFWNDKDMMESCKYKKPDIVGALHDIYWHNRFNNIKKSPEEYQAYLNSGTNLIRNAKILNYNQ